LTKNRVLSIIEPKNHIEQITIKERKCFKCQNSVSQSKSLLKLKDNHWYCFSCIMYYKKDLFPLLKVNGYWYNLLNYLYNRKS